MKIELISSTKTDTSVFSRRKFMKYSIACLGLTLSGSAFSDNINSSVIHSNLNSSYNGRYSSLSSLPKLIWTTTDRIEAELLELKIKNAELQSGEGVSGEVSLINNSSKDKEGKLKLTLVNEWDIDDFSTEYTDIIVPANTSNSYQITNGPNLSVNSDTPANLVASSSINKLNNTGLIIRA